MTVLLPQPSELVAAPLQGVLGQAAAAGAQSPAWIAVEDPEGQWLRLAAEAPATERARGVLAATSEIGMLRAIRLGIGGALWLPPSTRAMTEACAAAAGATADHTRACAPALVDLAAHGGGELLLVTFANRQFWGCQLGDGWLTGLLVELARALCVLPAVVTWPALLVSGREAGAIVEAWSAVAAGAVAAPSDGVRVTALGVVDCQVDLPGLLAAALIDAETGQSPPRPASLNPVWELRSGRAIGWWSSTDPSEPASGGWVAVPRERVAGGHRWQAITADGDTFSVLDILTSDDVEAAEAAAWRVPGWVSAALRRGTPAALQVERLAARAGRARRPLWVSNVDQEALSLLIRLGSDLWIDGPAVPRA